jgi:hypothetical protein
LQLPLISALYYKEIFDDILSDEKKDFEVMVKNKELDGERCIEHEREAGMER